MKCNSQFYNGPVDAKTKTQTTPTFLASWHIHSHLACFHPTIKYLQSEYKHHQLVTFIWKYHQLWHLYIEMHFKIYAMNQSRLKAINQTTPTYTTQLTHAFTLACFHLTMHYLQSWYKYHQLVTFIWKYHQSWHLHMQCISQFCNEPVNAKTILRPPLHI